MRITVKEKDYLVAKIKSIDPNARIFLFGSRANDSKKGGDIDILILSVNKLSMKDKSEIRYGFIEKFGEQRIDLLNYTFNEENSFKSLILNDSVELI